MVNPVTYLKETINELRQVSWPSRETTVRLTIIVVVISLGVAAYVGGLDYGFTNLLQLIVK